MVEVLLQFGAVNIHDGEFAKGRVDGGTIRHVPRNETRHMGNRDMAVLGQKRSDHHHCIINLDGRSENVTYDFWPHYFVVMFLQG